MLAVMVVAAPSLAQQETTPDRDYYFALEELYQGNYERAQRVFAASVRTSIQTVHTRWIDAICYRAMLGETYYHQGRSKEALGEYNAACEIFLSYPQWLTKVDFRQPLQADNQPARRLAPWGRSERQVTYGVFPKTMLISRGEALTETRVRQGGALQPLQMWKVNAIEVVRTTALAIRRRNELLGPLAAHDPLNKQLIDTLSRGNSAPQHHWSNAWTELLLGLAQQGARQPEQALLHLNRALLVDGQYDHPLTGVALLAQAQLALDQGNTTAALRLATEASYAAYAYEDVGLLSQAFGVGHVAFLNSGAQGLYQPLATAADWAQRSNLHHVAYQLGIALAEQLVRTGEVKGAGARLASLNDRAEDLAAGRLGPQRRYLEARIAAGRGESAIAEKRIAEAITQQRQQSLRNFQLSLANQLVDQGDLSSRLGTEVYAELLRDPQTQDWAYEPLETLTHLMTNHDGSLNRWLTAALNRQEVLAALEITELAKRRRFWLAQPYGGRLLALRHLLQASSSRLSAAGRLQRHEFYLQVPQYKELLQQATALRGELQREPLFNTEGRLPSSQLARVRELRANAQQCEALLLPLVLDRKPTDFDLPPNRSSSELQKALQPGQALVVFHQLGNQMLAFVLTHSGYHQWQLSDTAHLEQQVGQLLRDLGHFGSGRKMPSDELVEDKWHDTAQQLASHLLENSRLDLHQTTELILVPDGVLWHLPLEVLLPTSDLTQPLIDLTQVRYAPTASFAVGNASRPRPIRTTAVVAPNPPPGEVSLSEELAAELIDNVAHPFRLPAPLPVPSPLVASLVEQLIVLDEMQLEPTSPYTFTPLPRDRTAQQGSLAHWLDTPFPACERMLLAGTRTLAETGLKAERRGRSAPAATVGEGRELFHLSCTLFASGTQTLLVSRWQTGGRTHRELLREFARELPQLAAADAWRRSVTLARSLPVDIVAEPRLEPVEQSQVLPTAEHPFLWAGYLLLDTGYHPTASAGVAAAADALPAAVPTPLP